jgi:glycosyltransferase involved in cell wall biosynthesis
VVPSTFPESFGMVAVEAAACGALPVSADHSGLAEVTRTLAGALGPPAAEWLSFGLGPRSVRDLAHCLIAWLGAPEALRGRTRVTLARTAAELFSWQGVARGVLAAVEGRLDELVAPAPL